MNLRLASLGLALLVLVLGSGVRHLDVAFDIEAMYASFTARQTRPTASLLLVSPPDQAAALARSLAEVPGVREVRVPALDEGLLERIPASQQERAAHALRGKPASDVVPLSLTVDRPAPLAAIRALTTAPLVGPAVLDEAHERSARDEQLRLFPALAGALALALFVLLRRPLDVLVVLGSVGAGLLALAGTLGWLGLALGGPNLLLLPLLAVLGLADSLHLLREASTRTGSPQERAEGALRSVAPACALTSLTTALAFLALLTSGSPPIRTFGLLAAYGMGLAFLTGLVLPASVLSLSPTPGARGWVERLTTNPPRPPAWSVLLLLLAVPSLGWLTTDLKLGGELSDGDPDLLAQHQADQALGGVFPLRLALETNVPDGTADPQVVWRLLTLQRRLEQDPAVGAVLSYADPLGWIAGSQGRRPEQLVERRGTPEARERKFQRVHQAALDAGAADTPLPLFDDDRSAFYVYVRYRDVGARAWRRSVHYLQGFEHGAPEVRVALDGYVPLAVTTLDRLPVELTRVLGASLVSALLVVGLRVRRWRRLLPVVPILACTVLATLVTLACIGQPLNHTNLFVLSLAIGLGVDAWLHLQDHGERAIPAVLWTTLVLAVGMLALQLSGLQTVRRIGWVLLSSTLVNAWVSLALYRPEGRLPQSTTIE